MLVLLSQKVTPDQKKQVSEDFEGYVKVVVDVDRKILAAGGKRHVDGEQLLLENGSKQDSLWGGGIDFETGEIDYNSMINLRPGQGNPSREILDEPIRTTFDTIVKELLL